MGDREVIEIRPADARDDLTPQKLPPARQPKDPKTYRVTWVIEVEADTPLNAARQAWFCQMLQSTVTYEVSEVCQYAAQRYGPPITIDLILDAD
jgi:hypothetical protein